MSLLTTPYNPTAAVEVLVHAMEAGKRRQAQEQQIIAGLSKAIADDRRHALEWDRLQAFNEAKEAADNAQYGEKFAEDRFRDRRDNAPVTIPSTTPVTDVVAGEEGLPAPGEDVASSLPPVSGPTESVDLYNAGGPMPMSRSLIPGNTEAPQGFTEVLADKRAQQLQQGLAAVREAAPEAGPEVESAIRALHGMSQGQNAAASYPAPTLGGEGFPLAQAGPVDPLKPVEPAGPSTLPPDGNIAGALPARAAERMVDPGAGALLPPPIDRLKDYAQSAAAAGMPIRQKNLPALHTRVLADDARARTRAATAATKPPPIAMQEYLDKNGLTKVEGHNYYRTKDGTDVYVEQGVSGGIAVRPVKEVAKAQPKPFKGADGNTYLMRDGEPELIIRKDVSDSLPTAVPMKFATALAAQESSRANLDESTRVWEARKGEKKPDAELVEKLEKEVQTRQADLRKADAAVKALREQYPKLGAPAGTPMPDADKQASIAAAKAAIAKKPEIAPKAKERLIAAGVTEQELQAAGL